MEREYVLSEKNNTQTLLNKSGAPLITFEKKGNQFLVTYHNVNIDGEDLGMRCAEKYGDTFQMSITCDSENSLSQCQSRFIELATNGFTSDLRQLISMDWDDLERICFQHPNGRWFSLAYEGNNVDPATLDLVKRELDNCKKINSAIVCVEGSSLSALAFVENLLSNRIENNNLVLQVLFNEDENMQRADIWIFSDL